MTMSQTLQPDLAVHGAPAQPGAAGVSDAVEALDAFAADEGQIRHDLVIRVRRQIELGIYDEDQRIDALLDRLMTDLAVD